MSLALLLLSAVASAQTWAPGAVLPDAASIQVTPAGLNSLGVAASVALPARTDLDPIVQSGTGYDFELENAWVGATLDDMRIVPRMGSLDIQADLTVWLNEPGDLFDLYYKLAWILSESCETRVAPFPVFLSIPAALTVQPAPEGGNRIDVSLGDIDLQHGLTNSHIDPELECNLTTVDQVLGFFGLSFVQLLIDQAEPFLIASFEEQRADLEAQLEEAFAAARYDDVTDVSGVALEVLLEPREVVITPDGLDIRTRGRVHAEQAACMASRDPNGSTRTDSAVPALSANPAGTQLALHLSDEFADQALYAIWRSGLLCYDLGGSDLDLPIPLNTSLLGMIGGDGFVALFPDEAPMDVMTAPDRVPVVDYAQPEPTVVLRELGVDFYTDVDFRKARALGIDLEADVGVGLVFDVTTGVLDVDVGLTADDLRVIAEHNELVAGTDEAVAANFGGVLDVILGQFLGDALTGGTFGLPSMDGVGLTSLATGQSGGGDWLGVRAEIGAVTYDNSDPDAEGCGGCSGGCSTSRGAPHPLLVLLPLLAWRRRR